MIYAGYHAIPTTLSHIAVCALSCNSIFASRLSRLPSPTAVPTVIANRHRKPKSPPDLIADLGDNNFYQLYVEDQILAGQRMVAIKHHRLIIHLEHGQNKLLAIRRRCLKLAADG